MTRNGGLFAEPRRVEEMADMLANVWQLGYVTTDLDRAMEVMAEQFGLRHCVKVPSPAARRSSPVRSRPIGRRGSRWAPAAGWLSS